MIEEVAIIAVGSIAIISGLLWVNIFKPDLRANFPNDAD